MRRTVLWRSFVLLAGLTCLSLTAPAVALAETIGLDQGYVTIADDQWTFRFAIGNAHFSAITLPPLGSFVGSGFDIGCAALTCVPGEHLDMNNSSDGTVPFGTGNVYYRGVSYNDVTFGGRWEFDSRGADAPSDGSPTWTPMAPFGFSGTFTASTRGLTGPRNVFSIAVHGNGMAHADLRLGEFGYELAPGGTFTYKFNAAPATPEPASFLLIATGAAVVWTRMRRTTRGAPSR